MIYKVALLAAALQLSSGSFVSGPSIAPAVQQTRLRAISLVEDGNVGKELLDSAKDEEEREFLTATKAEAALARSPEVLAALRAVGETATAALKDDPKVVKALEAKGKSKPAGKLAKVLRKPTGTMALVGEGVTIDAISLGGFDLNDPDYLSGQFRTGGCVAACVRLNMDDAIGDDALDVTVAEQATARGDFPGPIPVIARGPFVSEVQLAAAAAAGAIGVVLPIALNGAEKTAELAEAAAALGLEALVRVSDAEQVEAAVAMGAKIMCVGDCTLEEAAPLIEGLPKGKDGVVTVADLPTLDVRGAWMVRDAGFNAMIGGKAMIELCARDRVPPTAVIKAIMSKGSVKYGLGMQKGRLEGAKEDLGTIAM